MNKMRKQITLSFNMNNELDKLTYNKLIELNKPNKAIKEYLNRVYYYAALLPIINIDNQFKKII